MMNKKKYEELLKVAFRENIQTPKTWTDRTKELIGQTEAQTPRKWRSRKLAILILILAMAVPVGVYAGFKLLGPSDTALLMERYELAEVFDRDETDIISKVDEDYTVSLLGMVSGKQLDELDIGTETDKQLNYVALAVQRTDGHPIEDYDNPDISVSAVIEGLDPLRWNAMIFNSGWQKHIEDGVLYCIAEWDDIQMFGYRKMYVAVMEDDFLPSREFFNYDKKSGKISQNENCDKVNLLFEIAPDKNKINQKAAEKWLAEKEAEWESGVKKDNELSLESDKVIKDGITFMTRDQWGCIDENDPEYHMNFFVKGDDIKSVQLTASKGTLLEPERISKAEYEQLDKEMNARDLKPELRLVRQEGIYRVWHYKNASRTIKIDHSILTKDMYPEESLSGLAKLKDLKNMEISITVTKKNGQRVSATALMTARKIGDNGYLFAFKFK